MFLIVLVKMVNMSERKDLKIGFKQNLKNVHHVTVMKHPVM